MAGLAENGCFGRKLTVSAKNVYFGTNSMIKYRVHGTLPNQPDELSMMEKLIFGRNSQFSAENTLSTEWPKTDSNTETFSAENSPKFRPNLSAVSFGRNSFRSHTNIA